MHYHYGYVNGERMKGTPAGVREYYGNWVQGNSYSLNSHDGYGKQIYDKKKIPLLARSMQLLAYYIVSIFMLFMFGLLNLFYELFIPIFEAMIMPDFMFYIIDNLLFYGQMAVPAAMIVYLVLAYRRKHQVELAWAKQAVAYYQAQEEKDKLDMELKRQEASKKYYDICPYCGGVAEDGDKVCSYCGSLLDYHEDVQEKQEAGK